MGLVDLERSWAAETHGYSDDHGPQWLLANEEYAGGDMDKITLTHEKYPHHVRTTNTSLFFMHVTTRVFTLDSLYLYAFHLKG